MVSPAITSLLHYPCLLGHLKDNGSLAKEHLPLRWYIDDVTGRVDCSDQKKAPFLALSLTLRVDRFWGAGLRLSSEKEQYVVVVKLDALSAETQKLEAIYKQKLADLEELKKSVLKKAFAGEL